MANQTVRADDGRVLSIVEGGDGRGKPVFVLHGTPESRLLYGPHVADASGAYILHFDNSFSLFASKQVTVSYDVTSSGGGGIPEFPP